MSTDHTHTTTDVYLPRRMLERPCYGHQDCTAGPGELCTARDGTPMLTGTHVQRFWDSETGSLPVVAPAWTGPERRRASETEIRDDEQHMIAMRLTYWLSGLSETDARTPGVLAAIDVVRGER